MTPAVFLPRFPSARASGFTLVEMIVVIAIAGIVAAMVAVFIRAPVEAYVDTARRARLTEQADTALRRLARDVRTALPNSVRVVAVGTSSYLEFVPTLGGGRYRQYPASDGSGDSLDFNSSDGAFDVVGPVPEYANGQSLCIYNLGPGSGADAYAGNNCAVITSANANPALFSSDAARHNVTFAARQFPLPSPSARFHVVAPPVTYECAPVAGTLTHITGYAVTSAQPRPPAAPAVRSLLADGVADCGFTYGPINARTNLLTVWLQIAEAGESVRLVHQIHIQNAP